MSEEYKAVPAEVHRKRGSCCKSGCIHCPYGFTIKKYGLKFQDLESDNDSRLQKFEISINIDEFTLEDYKFVYLKETLCGIIRKDKLFVREFELLVEFRDQGIDKPIIESYYFY